MTKVFVDTNIMIDVMIGRKPFLLQSSNIFQLAVDGVVELFTSALSFVNAFYISRKELGKATAFQKIRAFHDVVRVTPMDEEEMEAALLMGDKDFEDNLQYCSAISAGCDVIVTRNIKDFPESGVIPVMLPGAFLDSLD